MKRIITRGALTLTLAALSAASLSAQAQSQAPNASTEPVLAKELAPARNLAKLTVTSGAFQSGGTLGDKYTQNGDNVSPPITWSRGPAGTMSYVVLTEDAGVNRPDPVSHWVIYDIPSTVTNLPENTPTEAKLDNGAMQGLNVRKATGFIGPKPPAGQMHPYHFEVFALNKRLNIDPATADRAAVVAAMKGHVLALGDLSAYYTGK